MTTALGLVAAVLAVVLLRRLWARLRLSLAKHPGLVGHPRMARLLARALPAYAFDEDEAFGVDGAPPDVVERRQQSFFALAGRLRARAPRGIDATAALRTRVPDLDLTLRYRVPFAFARLVEAHLPGPRLVTRADGSWLTDLDGRRSLDLSGSYGVDLLGVERYRDLVEEGWAATRDLGLVLGPTHPVMIDNVARLRALSGHDAVSFHMSGTEAVMQAIRLARYHTRRRHLVRFAGAYHGWSSDVQAGPGNPRAVRDVFTLSEMSPRTLAVLRTRSDIAAVLVNPLQALAPNRRPAADAAPLARSRSTVATRDAYAGWLRELREVCDDRGIVLIF
ncbi:MAG: aminotransferase class III-fold pyridoxal phosphate-dependent enzyme, partial [Myxococcota bacterium]